MAITITKKVRSNRGNEIWSKLERLNRIKFEEGTWHVTSLIFLILVLYFVLARSTIVSLLLFTRANSARFTFYSGGDACPECRATRITGWDEFILIDTRASVKNTEYFTLKRRQKANAHDAFKSKVTPRESNRNYEILTGDGIFFSVIIAPIEFNGSIKMRNSRQDSVLVFGEGYLGNRG